MRFPFKPTRVALSVGCALLASAAGAASLGDIRVTSSLGASFEAEIPVVGTPDEALSRACFRLVAPRDAKDMAVLYNARLEYQSDGDGGTLWVRGLDPVNEPLLVLGLRIKCPGDDERVYQRDYSVLLDPSNYAAAPARKAPTVRRSVPVGDSAPVPIAARSKPPLGSVWIAESRDTVEQIARRYFPNDEQERAWLIDQIHELNPDIPQNSKQRLAGGAQVQLPLARTRPEAPPLQQVVTPDPGLSIATAAPNAARGEALSGTGGEYGLRLSEPELDLSAKSNLSPEESLKLRENLLLLASDDQTAQLLQLKYQLAQMEKQLAQMKAQLASPPPPPAKSVAWWDWWPLLALLIGAPLAVLVWRWRARQSAHEIESYSMMTDIEPSFPSTLRRPTQFEEPTVTASVLSAAGDGMRDLAHGVSRMASEWQHSDEMDVVAPGNVTEEAQLLVDHGLIQQAVNLLGHEIESHPTALALWMKLFEVLSQNDMRQVFQERAVAFRLQFASDTLWHQVQALGRSFDVDNPLYTEQEDETLELPPLPEPDVLPDLGPRVERSSDLAALEFEIEPAVSAPQSEHSSADDELMGILSAPSPVRNEVPLFSPDEFMISSMQPRAPVEIDPTQFASDDPELAPVADLLARGETQSAFQLLERLLYNGTTPQRDTAMRWLDKLFPLR
ncbi:type IV pilus assembly protein FimV [Chitinibacteraceae bacterium HSL-7]